MSEQMYGQDGANISTTTPTDGLVLTDPEVQSQRNAEHWISGVQCCDELSENGKLNLFIGVYRKCYLSLSIQRNDRRFKKMMPNSRGFIEAANKRTEQMHTYRQGIHDLASYVACTEDSTLMAEVSDVLRMV